MTTYTYSDLINALRLAGIENGDVVHVHSALFPLGVMEGVDIREIPAQIYRAFREVIGETGTLTAPSAFEDYARFGTPYDCRRSPVDRAQGAFSEYVTEMNEAVRTYCPMCAVSAVGPLAEDICHQYTGSEYGTGCAWEMLLEHDAKMCFLGVRPSKAFTYTGYIQARFGVPHFYNKIYTVPIYEDGEPVQLPVTAAVRYLNPAFKIAEDCDPFENHLFEKGLIDTQPIGRGALYTLASTKRIFDEGTKKLQENLYYFCKTPPQFIPGEIPMDGSTGAFKPNELRFGADYDGR